MRITVLATVLVILLQSAHASDGLIEGSQEEIQSDEFLEHVQEDIRSGSDIKYDNKLIKGDLDLSRLDLPWKLAGPNYSINFLPCKIAITNSKIDGSVESGEIIFQRSVDFTNTIFNGPANFNSAEFDDGANFNGATFCDCSIFSDSTFKGYTTFNNANFIGDLLQFDNSYFKSAASFNNVSFIGPASFTNSYFAEDTVYSKSNFRGQPTFKNVTFNKDVEFKNSVFEDGADFTDARFSQKAHFSNSIFKGNADFKAVQFVQDVLFRNVTLNKNLNFEDAKFNQDALFEKVKFNANGIINLNDTQLNKFYARWANIEGHLKYNEEAYLYLIANYKILGWHSDANDCYYKYREDFGRIFYSTTWPCILPKNGNLWAWRQSWYSLFGNSFNRIVDWFYMFIYGYGVKPERPLLLIPVVILVFSLFFWKVDRYPLLYALSFSTTVFLSGTGRLFVEAPKYEPSSKNSQALISFSRIMFNFERLLGMIIFVALIVAVSNTILRS